MKKSLASTQRLTLNRDTLRWLNSPELRQVEGAATAGAFCGDTYYESCNPVSVKICPASHFIC